jgi:hypothetical protein
MTDLRQLPLTLRAPPAKREQHACLVATGPLCSRRTRRRTTRCRNCEPHSVPAPRECCSRPHGQRSTRGPWEEPGPGGRRSVEVAPGPTRRATRDLPSAAGGKGCLVAPPISAQAGQVSAAALVAMNDVVGVVRGTTFLVGVGVVAMVFVHPPAEPSRHRFALDPPSRLVDRAVHRNSRLCRRFGETTGSVTGVWLLNERCELRMRHGRRSSGARRAG